MPTPSPRVPTPGPFAGAVALVADKGLAELAVYPEISATGEPVCRVEAVRRGTGQKLMGQMTPNDLRATAFNMLLVAEAAESDASVFRYLTTVGGLEPPVALTAIGHMRSLRAAEPLDDEPVVPDDDACPNDPDGLHHIGCGCEVDHFDNPVAVDAPGD